jgi:hypothetical protein
MQVMRDRVQLFPDLPSLVAAPLPKLTTWGLEGLRVAPGSPLPFFSALLMNPNVRTRLWFQTSRTRHPGLHNRFGSQQALTGDAGIGRQSHDRVSLRATIADRGGIAEQCPEIRPLEATPPRTGSARIRPSVQFSPPKVRKMRPPPTLSG